MHSTAPALPVELKGMQYLREHPAFLAEYNDLGPVAPSHPLMSRLVTSHRDINEGNILDRAHGGGLCLIDLETASLDCAVYDVMACVCSFFMAGAQTPEARAKRAALVEGYLQGCGVAVSQADVRAILLDAHLFAVFAVRVWMSPPGFLAHSEQEAIERLRRWKGYAQRVRDDEAEATRLLEEGPQKRFAAAGLIDF